MASRLPSSPADQGRIPLVGRDRETAELTGALERVRGGRGETWSILGPGGMGKTRLLRWLETEAVRQGFEARTGACLRESIAPFFPFEQVFRRGSPSSEPNPPEGELGTGSLAPVLIVEEPRPRRFWSVVEARAPSSSLLVVSRERPTTLRKTRPSLSTARTLLCLTRIEGPDNLAPGALDALAERVEHHLRSAPGSVAAIEGIEYLVSQGSFPPVLRLLQFLRDVAEDSGGHVIVAVNPGSLEARETSLLESEAEVLRESPGPAEPTRGAGTEPPSTVLLRYLSTLETACRTRPQLVVLDDLQWADQPSVAAFQFLARNLRALPVLLVGAMRDEAATSPEGTSNAMDEVREGLQREGLLRSFTLEGLGAEDARRMGAAVASCETLEARAPDALASLVRRTEGNPYFLREIFFQLLEDGRLHPEGTVAVLDLAPSVSPTTKDALPDTVRRLVVRRLQGLTPAERAFLDCASVAGSEFDLVPIEGALGISASDARARVEALHRRHRVVEPEGDRWCCAHPLVWEVTLAEMPLATRQRIAQGLATWFIEHRPGDVALVARLLYEANDAHLGRPWALRAFREAVGRFSAETAAVYLRWIRTLRRAQGKSSTEQVLEEVRLAQEIDPLGNPSDARDLLKDLLQEEPPPPVRAEVLAALAFACRDIDLKGMEEQLGRLEALAKEDPASVGPIPHAFGALSRSQVLSARLDHVGSLACLEECQRWVDPLPQDQTALRIKANILSQRVYALTHVGRVEEARREADAGIALLAPQLPALTLGPLINARGVLKRQVGDHAGAYADFRECARMSRQCGRILGVCISGLNAVGSLAALGDLDRGEHITEEMLDLARKFTILRAETGAHAYLAEAALLRGQWEKVREEAAIALEQSRRTGRALWVSEMEALLAMCRGELDGDLAGARGELERSLAAKDMHDPDSILEVRLALSRLAARGKDWGTAREQLRKAREAISIRPTAFFSARLEQSEAELAEAEGRPDEAEAARARATELMEQVRREWPKDRPGEIFA